MWLESIAKSFDDRIMQRGAVYANEQHVRSSTPTPDGLVAFVIGTETYTVRVHVDRTAKRVRMQASCTCPYEDLCKHIWAALVANEDDLEHVWGEPPAGALRVSWVEPSALVGRNGERHTQADVGARSPGRSTSPSPPAGLKPAAGGTHAKGGSQPRWKRELKRLSELESLRSSRGIPTRGEAEQAPITGPLWYVVMPPPGHGGGLVLQLFMEDATGTPGRREATQTRDGQRRLRAFELRPSDAERLEAPDDRAIAAMLIGAAQPAEQVPYSTTMWGQRERGERSWHLNPLTSRELLAAMHRTGRLSFVLPPQGMVAPLAWKAEHEWVLGLEVIAAPYAPARGPASARDEREWCLRPCLQSGDERRALGATLAISLGADGAGLVLWPGELALIRADQRLLDWCDGPLGTLGVRIRPSDTRDLLTGLSEANIPVSVRFPPEWGVRFEAPAPPRARLSLLARAGAYTFLAPSNHVWAQLDVVYDGVPIAYEKPGDLACVVQRGGATVAITRDRAAEDAMRHRLIGLGCTTPAHSSMPSVHVRVLGALVQALLAEGWEVRGELGAYRQAGTVKVKISSGVDWFELTGTVEYDDGSVPVAAVLDALAAGKRFVTLASGAQGLLPARWLDKHAAALGLGRRDSTGVRFHASQLSVVDALLEQMPEARADAKVARARERLKSFDGIAPRGAPRGFIGSLRPYQREGLGWMAFLHEFGFGGCLADDMGLGKTVQLIAHMLDVRRRGDPAWLVVAPKSVCNNWVSEAAKFAPHLKVVSHTGQSRGREAGGFASCDMVVTTYSTMRLDIERLSRERFGCVVLDEAQAIKNASSQASKAARLLVAPRRLALTGTPVENRVEDLWSIFEFLNPGMLGELRSFQRLMAEQGAAVTTTVEREGESGQLLRRALRPFMLRRTKAAVARDLPARIEQVLMCDLEGPQKALYASLRAHYQSELLGRVRANGMNRTRMHVLEALLRLRQAACHARLVQSDVREPASAKCAALLERLEELRDEGHKALVFSQFTALLDLVAEDLKKRGMPYERLDGQVTARNRTAAIERFQKGSEAGVFLISLKAGGTGLNLTAAGYVFLLDPWWNPAVEAQAIDRAHRLGQERTVLAYRMIARGTVEERILQLQEQKRSLAASIVSEQDGPLASMSAEDLEWILS